MPSISASLRVRPAAPSDREFVRRLSTEVFARFGDYETYLPRAMELPWMRTAIADFAGRPVAFVMCSQEDLPRGEIDLVAIAVVPGWQRRGIARALLARVERDAMEEAPARAEAAVRLTVAEDNFPARRLFESAGYRPVSDRPGTYPAGQRSLALRKRLHRSELDSDGPRPELG